MRLRDEVTDKIGKEYCKLVNSFGSVEKNLDFNAAKWGAEQGLDACEAQYLPMLEKLESALKKSIEFGEYAEWAVDKYKDIQQLDIDARQALAELAEFKKKMNGGE